MSKNFYITYTGERVYPDNLGDLKINLMDIAHHLTNTQRFGGALPFDLKYNVADHSIYLALYALEICGPKTAAVALLHDASEAYLGDVVSPLKKKLADYKELEGTLSSLIDRKYLGRIDPATKEVVKILDSRIVLDEAWDLIPKSASLFGEPGLKPLGIRIEGNRPEEETRQHFLSLCDQLGIED